jgi:hypothetical protein
MLKGGCAALGLTDAHNGSEMEFASAPSLERRALIVSKSWPPGVVQTATMGLWSGRGRGAMSVQPDRPKTSDDNRPCAGAWLGASFTGMD